MAQRQGLRSLLAGLTVLLCAGSLLSASFQPCWRPTRRRPRQGMRRRGGTGARDPIAQVSHSWLNWGLWLLSLGRNRNNPGA